MSYNPSTNQAILTPTIVLAAASPYTVLTGDQFIEASASATASTLVNLPAATGSGRTLIVKRMDNFGKKFPVSVMANGPDLIDLAAQINLTVQFQAYSFEDAAPGVWSVF